MTDQPRLYTAGAMEWHNNEDSSWRRSLDAEIDGAEFLHPFDTYFDHGGDLVGGAVAEDMAMINRADAVVALLSTSPQVGTLTEVVHAAATGTPVLLFVTPEIREWNLPEDAARAIEDDGAWCRASSTSHWFLLNYLTGDTTGGRADAPGNAGSAPAWVRDWSRPEATVVVLRDADDREAIQQVTESWVANSLEAVDVPTREEVRDAISPSRGDES